MALDCSLLGSRYSGSKSSRGRVTSEIAAAIELCTILSII